MKRSLILLLAVGVLAAGSAAAHARITRLAIATADADWPAVGATTDGTFAFRTALGVLRYGDADTGRIATATLASANCNAVDAAAGAVLVTCPERAAPSATAPLVLDTGTGTLAPAPGGQFLAGAGYERIGTAWIEGAYAVALGPTLATFINRRTGVVLTPPGLAYSTSYDLDGPGPPTPRAVGPGQHVLARQGALRVVERGPLVPGKRHRLQLERRGKTIAQLATCTYQSCLQAGVAGHTVAWVDHATVVAYDIPTAHRRATHFANAADDVSIIVQPRQVLVTVNRKQDRRNALFAIR